MAHTIIKRIVDDPVLGYKISDMDDAGDPSYYGYVDKFGGWYILRLNVSSGSARYAMGLNEYETNWGNRATSVVYDHFMNIF